MVRQKRLIYDMRQLPAILTVGQVAQLLQYSQEAVKKWCQKGTIPASKIGGEWRIVKTDIMDLLKMSAD